MRELCLLHGNGKRNGWPTGAKMPVRAAARSRRAALLSAVCLFALPSGFLARAMAATMANADCLDCHLDPSLAAPRGGTNVSLCVNTNALARSVHGALACTDCHAGIKELPHPKMLPAAQCADCHDKETEEYKRSIHGFSGTSGASAAARCVDCHGAHNIIPSKDPQSPVFKLNLPHTCAKCHSNPSLTAEYRLPYPMVESQYTESIHGRALMKKGLVVVPSCNDCHGVHDIRRSVDHNSPVHHANVDRTCGKCHLGVQSVFDQSVHGSRLKGGDGKAPNCVDCHTAHEIETPAGGHFKAASDQRCGRCHADRLARYRETYHGKAMALGRPNQAPDVAACYDCHGHHDVLPPSDSASRLSATNILATCRKCHPKAENKFTQYVPHADPLDRQNYPYLYTTFVFMTSLLIGVFIFFGLHAIFWLFRLFYLYVSDSKRFREMKMAAQADGEWFVRFTPFHRFLHMLVVISFLLLVVTGIPLKFYESHWAGVVFRCLGGPDVARALHRFGAIITFLYFALHILELVRKAWRGRHRLRDPRSGRLSLRGFWNFLFGPDSLFPSLQDWRDFVAHQRWFFRGGPRPQFDRWTYWEKFDYLAVFWGVAMIGLSGLVMWFPEFTTRFLPGWIINIALIIHSDEALLAAGFIFTFHFFNTHFRPDKFPLDSVIFSGRVSRTEMLHDRKRWYDRLVAAKALDGRRGGDEWEHTKPIASALGFFFFGLGVILLVLIIYAMSGRLTHGIH